ncbi:glycosyltransferase family 2 protein [bacterium]|jgi:rSAM/selenodomain-associated transferase 2|nr:glycosyltransferase family 2 protein [bacterium]
MISVIVPVYHEQQIDPFLAQFKGIDFKTMELIVVDGDKDSPTISDSASFSGQYVFSDPGRATQMNRGAALAKGEVLLFLHADTWLPEGWPEEVCRILSYRSVGAFDLGFSDGGWRGRLLARVASFRSRLTRIPFGDQAQFFQKETFDKLGGFDSVSIMEDVLMMQRIRRLGMAIEISRQVVFSSARRWVQNGWLQVTIRHLWLQIQYYSGVPVAELRR